MTTWSCKSALAGAALLALAACEDGQSMSFLEGIGSAPRNVALSRSQMANGAFTLVPPRGFCIDRRNLSQRFALLARCDTLGAPDQIGGAPLAIITISVTPGGADVSLPTAQHVADAARLARVDANTSDNNAITFRAEGPPPVAGLDDRHWRGTARVGDYLMGVAVYGPSGGRAISTEGREVLNELIRRTRAAS